MSGIARFGDLCIGIGSHGLEECPHCITGVFVSGSPNTTCNNRAVVRVPDIIVHNCPHCGIGMTILGSNRTTCNNIPINRINDIVTFTCGIGITITGSNDSNVE